MGEGEGVDVDGLLNSASRDALAMHFALLGGDPFRAARAAVRSRYAVEIVTRLDGERTAEHERMLAQTRRLLSLWPDADAIDVERAERTHLLLVDTGPLVARDLDLAGLDVRALDLSRIAMRGTRLADCRFAASVLAGGCFDECVMASCDFARSDFERSSWIRATVARTSLAGAVLRDAILDGAMFVECDLRGADLSLRRRGLTASMARARFVRCDLRDTNWADRVLSGVRIIDCKLHGVQGKPTLDTAEIQDADMSPHGDGSAVASGWPAAFRGT